MRKILLVEDERIVALDISLILKSIPQLEVFIAHNGNEALAIAQKERLDLILMDISLKDELDGIQTVELLRQFCNCPVIYLTSYADEATLRRAKETGPVSYLLKPFNELELKVNVELALYKNELSNNYRLQEHWLAELLAQVGMGIIKTSFDNSILLFNDVAERLMGLRAVCFKGKRLEDFIKLKDQFTGRVLDLALLDDMSPQLLRLLNKSGQEYVVFLSARTLTYNDGERQKIFILEDLSARPMSPCDLAVTANILEQAFVMLQDGILFLKPDFTVADCNPALERLFGYCKEEIIGKNVNFLWEDENFFGLGVSKFQQVVQNELFLRRHAMEMRRKDGSWLPVEFTVAPLTDNCQQRQGWMLSITDDSERRAYEKKLRAARDLAEAANRAKSEFLANMSHELRTPLNSIIGMTELTLATELTAEQRESLEIVRKSAHSFLQLLNTILDFTRIEIGKYELDECDLDLYELIQQSMEILKPQALKKGLPLYQEIAADVPRYIKGDPLRLKQILLNLIGNAIKFTEQGFIRVSLNTEAGERIVFNVTDTGIGIPVDKQELIFESFIQADGSMNRKYGGAGLGLTIAKRLLEMMGGQIEVFSRENEGSSFVFRLPLRLGQPVQKKEVPEFKPILPKNKKSSLKILVAEDDMVAQKIIQRVLEKRGHTVFCVTDGNSAIEILHKARFDILLMDIEMPVLNGLETTKQIRYLQRSLKITYLPIIAMTAHARPEDRERCLAFGMDHYLAKPLNLNELISVVESYENMYQESEDELPSSGQEPVILEEHWHNFKKELEKDGVLHYNYFKDEADRYMAALNEALACCDRVALERLAEEIRILGQKSGLNFLRDDAFRLKLASRKKDLLPTRRLVARIGDDFQEIIAKII